MKRINALGAVALVAGCVLAGAPAEAAGTTTIVGQASYRCQFSAPGMPTGTDSVAVQLKLNVPTAVQPRSTLKLYGTLTLQFSEELRQVTKSIGTNAVDGYSDNFSTQATINGAPSRIVASRVQSAPTAVGDPMVVSMPISFPAFTVPAGAKGAIKLQLPQNGAAQNSVTNNPAKVAFTVVARTSGPGGENSVKFACFFAAPTPAVIGSIPVAAQGTAAPAGGSTSSGSTSGGAAAAGPTASTGSAASSPAAGSTAAQSAADAAPADAAAPGTDPVAAAPAAGAAGDPAAGGSAAATTPTTYGLASTSEPRGVYVPTGLLVTGGFVICLLSLAYAALTNVRLRALRRSVDQ